MLKKSVPPRHAVLDPFWPRVAQTFVGLFFIAAAYFKLTDSFFGARITPLANDIHYWLDSGFTLQGYDALLRFLLPYADILAAVVIACQMTAGVLIVYNKKLRWAGAVLCFVQVNILLSSFWGFGFIVFSGVAIWLAIFYMLRDGMTPRRWAVLTFLLVLLGIKYQHQRWVMGDPFPSSFDWHYAHFQEDIMSIHPVLKQWVMNFLDAHQSWGPWLWAAPWWAMNVVLLLMFTPLRIYAGLAWVLLWVMRELIWTTGVTGEGTLYVLTFFTWVTYEEYMRQRYRSGWLFPSRATWAAWKRRLSGGKKKR